MPFNRLWKFYSNAIEQFCEEAARNIHEHDSVQGERKGKIPWSIRFPPKKGIENRRPVTELDFASLYPSLIMAYNFSSEKIILNQEEADIVGKRNKLHKIEFLFNGHTLRACIRQGELFSKEAYWTEMVKITMKVMDDFHNKVNAFLKANNGTSYLKMAYVKQGQSQLFRFVDEKIMQEALNINNEHTIHQIVENTLKEARHKQWDFSQFIAMATWKSKVKNQCIQCFMSWMKEKGLKIPDPGERFSCMLVKGKRQRDEKGRLIL
ncbi:hypothetical protein RhiirC2_768620 [Rhizophagus irregularis]|uniref:DNA-directed DNA polymerase n=1 Tax=Rhizophagus irregularis TaxID=588596 RepID=A0A2N1P156_9GLOM|nr:hypothetical protein RhiirC2_768620 [Rhizophagus irregularis]